MHAMLPVLWPCVIGSDPACYHLPSGALLKPLACPSKQLLSTSTATRNTQATTSGSEQPDTSSPAQPDPDELKPSAPEILPARQSMAFGSRRVLQGQGPGQAATQQGMVHITNTSNNIFLALTDTQVRVSLLSYNARFITMHYKWSLYFAN